MHGHIHSELTSPPHTNRHKPILTKTRSQTEQTSTHIQLHIHRSRGSLAAMRCAARGHNLTSTHIYIYIYDGRGCLVRLCQEAIKRGGSEPAGLVNRQIPRFELSCSVRVGLTTKKLNSLIRRTAALFFESAVQLYVLTRKKN